MDRLTKLVPQPEFCQVLKELGFPQNKSALYWVDMGMTTAENKKIYTLKIAEALGDTKINWITAAPTAEELSMQLPSRFFTMRTPWGFTLVDALGTDFKVVEKDSGPVAKAAAVTFKKINETDAVSEADCLAKGIIHLLAIGELKAKK